MIQLLRSLFAGKARGDSFKKPPAKAKPIRVSAGGDYRAVSLESCGRCQAVGKGEVRKRYLLREVPRLPLANCTIPAKCTCKFRKHADRRDGDRRLFGGKETGRWYAGSERRELNSRRVAHV